MSPPVKLKLSVTALLAASSAWGAAAPADPSEDCRKSLDLLYQQEESQRASRSQGAGPAGVGAALEVARRQAAKDCLGASSDRAAPVQRFQAPLSVAPVGAAEAVSQATAPPLAAPLPLARSELPASSSLTTVTRCDSAGCWTSDGNYLVRSGPNLVGRPGLCSVQAGVLTCR